MRVLVWGVCAALEADEVRSSGKGTGVFLSTALLRDGHRGLPFRFRYLLSRRHAMLRRKLSPVHLHGEQQTFRSHYPETPAFGFSSL